MTKNDQQEPLEFLLAPEFKKNKKKTSSSGTVQGDISSDLNCVPRSRLLHLSGGLPGFLCLVKEEDGVVI